MDKRIVSPNMQEMIAMSDDVKKVCMPLFLFLTVRYFRIVRSYPDDSKFILCSNGFWLEQYFNEGFYDTEFANFKKVPKNFNGIAIHGTNVSSNPVLKFWSKLGPQCDYNNILGVFNTNENYLEVLNFGLSQDAYVAQNIFLNNQNLFMHFTQYFYKEAKTMMEKAYDLRFKVKPTEDFDFKQNWVIGLPDDYQSKVIENMPLEEIFIGDNLIDPALSKMEIKIIILLAKGYDKKDILDKEDISKGDLKSLLSSIMEKLNVDKEKDIKREIFVRKLMPKLRLLS